MASPLTGFTAWAPVDAGFVPAEVGALEVALVGDRGLILFHRLALCVCRDPRDQGMFGGEHHIRRAVERVGTRGEDRDGLLRALDGKFHLCALAASDPVPLKQLDGVRPVESVEFPDKAVRKRGDPQHPLSERTAFDGMTAHLAFAVDDLLIGQHGAKFGAPVHRCFGHIGEPHGVGVGSGVGRDGFRTEGLRIEPGAVDLQKNPLSPLEIPGVGGVDLPRPIVGKTDPLKLALEMGHVFPVVTDGCRPVLMAYCSAGRPNASQPMGCSTLKPRMRL